MLDQAVTRFRNNNHKHLCHTGNVKFKDTFSFVK
jgi:hypothetical protein